MELYAIENCCSIRALYHTWNLFLMFITLNKVYLKFWKEEPIFYGMYLQPISLACFAIVNVLYLLSNIFYTSLRSLQAVAYSWIGTLILIYPAAVIDRSLYYLNRQ